jgi:uncharacterized hydantoinase/oxoprolinase family protein
VVAARYIASTQTRELQHAVETVAQRQRDPVTSVVLSGSGEFLADRATAKLAVNKLGGRIVSLSRELGKETSTAATAHALVYLARQQSTQKELL